MTPTFILLSVVSFIILTNDNVAAAFYFVLKLVRANLKRHWWWITNNPSNPVIKYIVYRRSIRLAKELIKEINKDNET